MPPGLTSVEVSWVTAPTTQTSRPARSKIAYSGSTGVVVPFLVDVGAEVGEVGGVEAVGATDHLVPEELPALVELVVAHGRRVEIERVEHVEGRLVGRRSDANSEAPIRSPAPTMTVASSPPAARSCSTVPAHFDGVGVDATVEVVDADQVERGLGGSPSPAGRSRRRAGRGPRTGRRRRRRSR